MSALPDGASRLPRLLAAVLLALGAGARAEEGPLSELPYTPGLDLGAMDRGADPCVDFYAFACGGWRQKNPIPPDQASWSVYGKLEDENRRLLWGLLDEAARKPDAERAPEERLAGDYFAACMDEAAVEKAGLAPLAPDLAAVEGLGSAAEIAPLLGRLHLSTPGAGLLFGFDSNQSYDDAEEVVAFASAGGLGLPDREQYLAGDARSSRTRRAYRAHVMRMLELSGLEAGPAAAGARDVLRIETALARATLTRVQKRDPRRLWNRTTRSALDRLTPAFDWEAYLSASGAPRLGWLNVTEPRFYRAVSRQLRREPLSAWKHYLRWQLVHARAPHLGRALQQEHFAFTQGHLRGVKSLAPRWKRCVAWADRDLGEALGRIFVARAFPPSVKADAERMVGLVEQAMRRRLSALDWMGPATRQAALAKLDAMRNKVGFPERWRDYPGLRVERGDHAGNVDRALAFESRRQLSKIGQKVDRGEWQMTTPTVNASYDPSLNEMNFPAGVLLPPLWDPRLDLAPGYGNTGGTVGHELIHGFDDEGRRFDARGNLRDWWTAADARAFRQRARCVVEQYGAYRVEGEVRINSRLTLGEDLADLGGLALALDAWRAATAGEALEPRDGLAPEQRFFVGFAQWDCANVRPEDARQRALTDVHSPPRWRINGVVANLPDFARAFGCRAGQPLVRARPCRVW